MMDSNDFHTFCVSGRSGARQADRTMGDIKWFLLILDIEPSIYLGCPREALGPHGGKHCGASWIARVLHLGSTLRLATGAPARGGVRVRSTSMGHAHPKTFILHRFYKGFSSHLGGN